HPAPPPRPTLFPYTTLFRSGVLAHVGRLAAHVRAGDDEHAAIVVEIEIVRFERFFTDLLDDRVAAAADLDAIGIGQLRTVPVQRSEEHTSELQSRENLVCRL